MKKMHKPLLVRETNETVLTTSMYLLLVKSFTTSKNLLLD